MSDHTNYPARGEQPEQVSKGIRFGVNAATAPTIARGTRYTVSRISAGLFRVVLADKYPDCLVATPSLILSGGLADMKAVMTAVTPGTGTFDVTLLTGAVATDPPASANFVQLYLVLQNSSQAT